ncbi:hypothetical protein [Halomonas sp. PBN3]|uniref:hypothetical protein n=1 Tax=Halomonas sp. PBN3 TaxID=1397528 RepID=UPI0003B8434D|nr:hypothetical protein [Halomonas sp. PBN3]ERS85016.1 hypothetical protein Q671_02460 [Halomonas sp. PBN3]
MAITGLGVISAQHTGLPHAEARPCRIDVGEGRHGIVAGQNIEGDLLAGNQSQVSDVCPQSRVGQRLGFMQHCELVAPGDIVEELDGRVRGRSGSPATGAEAPARGDRQRQQLK